jgi:hypothetical protein
MADTKQLAAILVHHNTRHHEKMNNPLFIEEEGNSISMISL